MPQDGLREHGKVKLNRETGYCSLIAEDETEGQAKAFMSNFLFKAFSSTNAKIPKAVMDCLHYQVDSLMMQYDILLSLPFLSSQAPSSQLLTLWSRSGIHESFGELPMLRQTRHFALFCQRIISQRSIFALYEAQGNTS